jgi:two-component system, NtrC family, response regulator AtoC
MENRFVALLVYDRAYPLEALNAALKELSVGTYSVRTCEEARRLILQTQPDLIFTDTCLPDGSWADIVDLPARFGSAINVIVVSATEDVQLYISALQRGAFDFVLPPFERQGLEFVVRSGGEDARHRRKVRALAELA